MNILIVPGTHRAAAPVRHAIAFLDRLKEQGYALDYACLDADAPHDSAHDACAMADVVLTAPGPRHADAVTAFAKAAALHVELYAVVIPSALRRYSPLRMPHAPSTDCLIVGDLPDDATDRRMHGVHADDRELVGWYTQRYTETGIRRIAHRAFRLAGTRSRRLTSVDQADRAEAMAMWRDVVADVALQYPDIQLEHLLIEQALERLVFDPNGFDTVLAGGGLARLLAAHTSVLAGLPGLMTRARVGCGIRAVYEMAAPSPDNLPADAHVDFDACAATNALSLLLRHAEHGSVSDGVARPPTRFEVLQKTHR